MSFLIQLKRFFPRNLSALAVCAMSFLIALSIESVLPVRALQDSSPVRNQSEQEAARKSSGCVSCHSSTDEPSMHPTKTVFLGCVDCHGGNASISVASGILPNSAEF